MRRRLECKEKAADWQRPTCSPADSAGKVRRAVGRLSVYSLEVNST